MANDTDKLEQTLTAIFGALGMFAILINLHLKGYEATNILDTIKDVAGLVVVITVFLVANKMFRRGEKPNFNKMFEDALKVWIAQNEYLMSFSDGTGKGKDAKRYCAMVIDHANFVTEKKLASEAAKNTEKATFVRLPEEDKKELDFRFNEKTFERQETYKKDNKDVDLGAILEQFSARINKTFGDAAIKARTDKDSKAVIVSFQGIEETEENAHKLVAIVEFVKTMVLALA